MHAHIQDPYVQGNPKEPPPQETKRMRQSGIKNKCKACRSKAFPSTRLVAGKSPIFTLNNTVCIITRAGKLPRDPQEGVEKDTPAWKGPGLLPAGKIHLQTMRAAADKALVVQVWEGKRHAKVRSRHAGGFQSWLDLPPALALCGVVDALAALVLRQGDLKWGRCRRALPAGERGPPLSAGFVGSEGSMLHPACHPSAHQLPVDEHTLQIRWQLEESREAHRQMHHKENLLN